MTISDESEIIVLQLLTLVYCSLACSTVLCFVVVSRPSSRCDLPRDWELQATVLQIEEACQVRP